MLVNKKKAVAATQNKNIRQKSGLVSYIIFIFARIGDTIIFIVQKLLVEIKLTFSILKFVWRNFLKLADFISAELFSGITFGIMKIGQISKYLKTQILTVLEKVSTPKKIKAQKLQKMLVFSFKKARSAKFRKTLSEKFLSLINFPKKIKFPNLSIHLPTLFWPKISFSKIFIRLISVFRIPKTVIGFSFGVLATLILIFVPYNLYLFLKLLPNPHALSVRTIPVTTQIFDRNGNILYEIYQNEDRKPIQFADIPDIVKQATIAIEDKQFYHHPGFSIIGIARATRESLFNKQLQGGSTITQQLIKNALLTPEVTFKRKSLEIILAFWAERIYTKDQILEMYLNQVPYGGTAWGIEAAAENFFGKRVHDLTLAEAAYLAGLPAAPTYYSPYGTHPELAKTRQEEVLQSMKELGYITKEENDMAKKASLTIRPQVNNIKAPHFVMYIREFLTEKYGERVVDQGGLRIYTSLDLPLQEKVQDIVTKNITDLQKLRVGNGAAIVTNAQTGEILAMVGSKNYFDDADHGNVNVVISPRQPGSSIKPLMYAAALEKGFTAATFIDDSPIAYTVPGQPTYAPVNYDGRFHGTVTLRTALANSYNVPAVKTLNNIGVKTLIDYGKSMGISTWTDESRFGLSLTLGGGEVTLYDMATAFGVFANKGERVNLDPILKITDYTGRVYYERPKSKGERVISSETSYILSSILSDNQARTPAFGSNSALVIQGKTVAVKTGTTNEKRDNWTIGYTPSYVTGVWVGNNDNTPMDPYLTSGVTGAAPIWNQIMQEVIKDKADEPFQETEKLVKLTCYGRNEYFLQGTQPKGGCPPLPSPKPIPSPSPN